jgi:DNA polymerase III subunit gamma/tau
MELANKYRPKRFDQVAGQEKEIEVIKRMVANNWTSNALMITGPFGTGKTTTARLAARALLCENRAKDDVEPCGHCESCLAMDNDSHPGYTEVDAASQGLIADVRAMKDMISYSTGRGKLKIICYDESHMLSTQAQNALLQTLEEGANGTMFIFCTTEANKMLPTIKSRSLELRMKLLTAQQINERLKQVCAEEGILIEPRALSLIASYVRGHVRDSLVTLGQLNRMTEGKEDRTVTEVLTRTYLRLDQHDDIYQLLTEKDRKAFLEKLEHLLCNYAATEMQELIGEALLNAFKTSVGVEADAQVDQLWLKRILETKDPQACLQQAEDIFTLRLDFSTINHAVTAFARVLMEARQEERAAPSRVLRPGGESSLPPAMPMRKPGK